MQNDANTAATKARTLLGMNNATNLVAAVQEAEDFCDHESFTNLKLRGDLLKLKLTRVSVYVTPKLAILDSGASYTMPEGVFGSQYL